MAAGLLSLPREILDEILGHLQAHDLVAFGQTNSQAFGHLHPSNKILWRNCFLNHFDDPRRAWARWTPTAKSANRNIELNWDWLAELRRRHSARQRIFNSRVPPVIRQEMYESDVATLLSILETGAHDQKYINKKTPSRQTPSLNLGYIRNIFDVPDAEDYIHDYCAALDSPLAYLDLEPVHRHVTRARVFKRRVPTSASRLHIFYGLTNRQQSMRQAKGAARQIVYDWTRVSSASEWGPFKKDIPGEVNWEMLEAVASLMDGTIEKQYRGSVACPTAELSITYPLKGEVDWAGIEFDGTKDCWIGTYAFLDYTDLIMYNAARLRGSLQSLDDYDEAAGLISRLCLHIDMSLKDDHRLQTQLPVCADLPTLYFSGTSKSLGVHPIHAIGIRGFASLIPGGREVRWRFIVSYAGDDQWQLEGVQPGGIRSGPIYGLWHGCDHENGGPIGPFAYVLSDGTDLPDVDGI